MAVVPVIRTHIIQGPQIVIKRVTYRLYTSTYSLFRLWVGVLTSFSMMDSSTLDNSLQTNMTIRLDWSEMDLFGHINNVSYFKYIQAARVNYWEQIGLNQIYKETNFGPMLASCTCNFKRPLFFPGQVQLHTKISFIKNSSFGLEHILMNDHAEVVAEAKDVIVFFNFEENHKTHLPDSLKNKMIGI